MDVYPLSRRPAGASDAEPLGCFIRLVKLLKRVRIDAVKLLARQQRQERPSKIERLLDGTVLIKPCLLYTSKLRQRPAARLMGQGRAAPIPWTQPRGRYSLYTRSARPTVRGAAD